MVQVLHERGDRFGNVAANYIQCYQITFFSSSIDGYSLHLIYSPPPSYLVLTKKFLIRNRNEWNVSRYYENINTIFHRLPTKIDFGNKKKLTMDCLPIVFLNHNFSLKNLEGNRTTKSEAYRRSTVSWWSYRVSHIVINRDNQKYKQLKGNRDTIRVPRSWFIKDFKIFFSIKKKKLVVLSNLQHKCDGISIELSSRLLNWKKFFNENFSEKCLAIEVLIRS